MTINDKMYAHMDGDFVVLLIGMRMNQIWKIHKWLPVVIAMLKMLKELRANPDLGFLHQHMWLGRTTICVQYWRSMDHLLSYAKNSDTEHLPAWRMFNRLIGKDGSVGVWHETYAASKGTYEAIYTNMPPFGLGRVGILEKAQGKHESARGRLAG